MTPDANFVVGLGHAQPEEQTSQGALTSSISCVRLMFIAQTSSNLILTTSAFRHRSCIPFTIPSVMPAFPTLSLFLTLIPIPCSRRSSSRGSASSAADGGAEAASLPRPLRCRRAAGPASPSAVAQLGSRMEPTRWRGTWARVGTGRSRRRRGRPCSCPRPE